MALTQISTAGVKDDAVTSGKIPANAVGSSEIAANAVGSSELADNAVDTAAIANDAVTAGKLADDIAINTTGTITAASFSGPATQVSLAAQSTDTDCFPVFSLDATGNQSLFTKSNRLSFNSASGALSATSFVGDGSNLTGITQTTINSNADDRLITGSGTANTLNAEANITFSSSTLGLSAGAARRVGVKDQTSSGNGGNLLVTAGSAHTSGTTAGDLLLATSRGTNSGPTGAIRFGYNDGSNGLGLDHEWMRFHNSGRISVGSTSQFNGGVLSLYGQGLCVFGQNTAHTTNGLTIGQEGSGVAQLRAYGSSSTSYGELDITLSTNTGTSSNSIFKFIKQTSGNSVLRLPSNSGIQFASYDESTSDGNSVTTNTLDDYEEGVFTPQMLFNSSEAGVAYSSRHASYVKVGSLVYIKGSITLTSRGSASGGASAMIGNFPFTIRDDYTTSSQEGFGMLTYWSGTNQTSNFIFWASQNSTAATIQRVNGSTTVGNADKNDFSDNSDIRFSLIYTAN